MKYIFITIATALIISGCSSYNSNDDANNIIQQTNACSIRIDKYAEDIDAVKKGYSDITVANNTKAMKAAMTELTFAEYNLHLDRYQFSGITPASIYKWEIAQNAVDSDYIETESLNNESDSQNEFKSMMRKIESDEEILNPIVDELNAKSGGMSDLDFGDTLEAQSDACVKEIVQEQQK